MNVVSTSEELEVLQAQVESHFLLNSNGVRFDSNSTYLVVTSGVLAENFSKASVIPMKGNTKNREIYNKSHGVYLTTVTQDVTVNSQTVTSLASLTEARRSTDTDGYFSNTKFSHKDGKSSNQNEF